MPKPVDNTLHPSYNHPITGEGEPRVKLQINGQSFSLAPKYAAGSQIDAAEAQALESLRLEKLRDALSKIERKSGQRLSQDEVSAFAESWSFEPKAASAWRRDQADVEARGLAELRVAAQLGLAPGDRSWEMEVAAALLDPELQTQARERARVRRELVERELDGLVG